MAFNLQRSTELAIDRTPVEIWSRILAFAISCPLLPTEDDGLIANLYLLQYDCEAIAAYWDSEGFRLACRLVCKAWKSLLDRYTHRLCLPLSEYAGFQRCQRIQFPPDRLQWTPCHKHACDYGGNYVSVPGVCPVRNGHNPDPRIIAKRDRNSVLAFVDQISSSTRRAVDLVTRFSGLRILALRAPDELHNSPISLPTLSSKCTSLTHLALYFCYQVVFDESQVLVLPNLHTLFLHIITGGAAELRPLPLSKWKLPKLRNLGVRANLRRVGKENYEEVHILIKNVGSHLQGLSFSWCEQDEEIISDQLWEWCPRLQYLEIATPDILALWPPPDTHATLVIILRDIKEELFLDSDLVPYARLVTHILLSRATTTKVYSFGMAISWATLRRSLDNYPRLTLGARSLLQLFECFQTLGYSFIDRYDIPIEAEEAKVTMKWLEEKCGSVLPNEVDPLDEF